MSSKVIGIVTAGSLASGDLTVTLTVEHKPADSFSRSVDRAAMTYARRGTAFAVPGVKQWSVTDARYAHTHRDQDEHDLFAGTCLSDIVFSGAS